MEVKLTNNTTENNEALINVDEKALVTIINELVSAGAAKSTTDCAKAMDVLNRIYSQKESERAQFWRNVDAKNAFEKNVEKAMNACTATTPIATATVQANETTTATTQAPVEEATVTEKKEEGNAEMETIKKNIIMMELTKLKLHFGDSESHKIVDMCVRYIENDFNMTKLLVNLTKICYTEKEVYRATVKTLSPLMQIEYKRFDEIFKIIADVEFYC